MHPVAPSTIVRGPAALTISFITSADSQPWHVRWPEVKYSSMVTRLTPRNGVRTCVALSNACVSAMGSRLLFLHSHWLSMVWRQGERPLFTSVAPLRGACHEEASHLRIRAYSRTPSQV